MGFFNSLYATCARFLSTKKWLFDPPHSKRGVFSLFQYFFHFLTVWALPPSKRQKMPQNGPKSPVFWVYQNRGFEHSKTHFSQKSKCQDSDLDRFGRLGGSLLWHPPSSWKKSSLSKILKNDGVKLFNLSWKVLTVFSKIWKKSEFWKILKFLLFTTFLNFKNFRKLNFLKLTILLKTHSKMILFTL